LLLHYGLSSDANRALLDKYLALAQRDVPANKPFEDRVELASLPSAPVSFTGMPDSVTDFVLAEAVLKSCPDRETGQSLLRAISERAGGVPNNECARRTLSRAQLDWGNAADALPCLSAAISENGKNFNALYLLGMANLRLAEQHKHAARETDLPAAKRSRLLARSVNPASAEAAFALYKAELNVSEHNGLVRLSQAMSLFPHQIGDTPHTDRQAGR
jgi:hypothetical protein